MADYLPQISSNWTTATWITAFSNLTAFAGNPPMSADDVYADGKTITIDTNINVASLRTTTAPRTGGVAGGGFRATNNTSLTANILAGTSTCLTFASASPNFFTLVGNVTATSTTQSTPCINNTSTGTINITGNIFQADIGLAGTGTYSTISNLNGGTLNIVGDLIGKTGSSGFNSPAFSIIDNKNESSTVNVRGNLLGGQSTRGSIGGQDANVIISTFGSVNIIGDIIIPSTNSSSSIGITVGNSGGASGGGQINIRGNIFSGGGCGFFPRSAIIGSTLTIVGNVSASNTANHALDFTSTTLNYLPPITITGDLHGSTASTGNALNISRNRSGTSAITINGNVYGRAGIGISISTDIPLTVNGSVVGGSAVGFSNTGTNFHYIKRVVGGPGGPTNPLGGTSAGISNVQNGLVYVEEIQFGAQGASPVSGPVFLVNRPNTVLVMEGPPPTFTETTLFGNLNVPNLFPSVSSVRSGITYGNGDFTGTMIVPPRDAVQIGVPVDNTVGTFVLSPESFWTFKRSNSAINDPTTIGYRIKNLATIPSVGSLIGSFNVATISGYSI